MAVGSFCLVLHGHLPYVLRHGLWPHGEDWLYEAAAETYLPILAMIDECEFLKGRPRLTIGLTPVLLEQLSQEYFQGRFRTVPGRPHRPARADHAEFKGQGQEHLAYLATRWEAYFTGLGEQFTALGRDIPKAYAARASKGLIEILTSNATHGYLPLLLEDSSVRAGAGRPGHVRAPPGHQAPRYVAAGVRLPAERALVAPDSVGRGAEPHRPGIHRLRRGHRPFLRREPPHRVLPQRIRPGRAGLAESLVGRGPRQPRPRMAERPRTGLGVERRDPRHPRGGLGPRPEDLRAGLVGQRRVPG